MNDLRTNYATNEAGDVAAANAAWVARHTVGVTDDHGEYTVTTVKALDPDQLRTVPMVDLRRPDCRTIGDKYAELMREHVRVVDCLQVVYLRLDALEAEQPALEYVAAHVERLERTARPPCDYCGQVDYWNKARSEAVRRLGELSAAGVAA
jgi:hypothetical protein